MSEGGSVRAPFGQIWRDRSSVGGEVNAFAHADEERAHLGPRLERRDGRIVWLPIRNAVVG